MKEHLAKDVGLSLDGANYRLGRRLIWDIKSRDVRRRRRGQQAAHAALPRTVRGAGASLNKVARLPGGNLVGVAAEALLGRQLYCHPGASGDFEGWQFNCHPNLGPIMSKAATFRGCVIGATFAAALSCALRMPRMGRLLGCLGTGEAQGRVARSGPRTRRRHALSRRSRASSSAARSAISSICRRDTSRRRNAIR